MLRQCEEFCIKGSILLSPEGININLSGTLDNIALWMNFLKKDPRFNDMTFKESYSDTVPFKRLKVKLKKEIITLRHPEIRPDEKRAPAISAMALKTWLDEKRDITLLDTRNDYEIALGTFEGAVDLQIADFCALPEAVSNIPKDKPIVMFCTGGVRCEKAGLHLLEKGFSEVYQLEGGILQYFSEAGGAHYQGSCFVFDERVALNPNLQPI